MTPVAAVAAYSLLQLYPFRDVPFPETSNDWRRALDPSSRMDVIPRLGRRGMDLLVQMAMDRIASTTERSYPTGVNVTTNLRDRVIEKIMRAKDGDLKAVLDNQTLDEWLALPAACGTNTTLSRKLAPVANTVRHVEATLPVAGDNAWLRSLEGGIFTPDVYGKLKDLAASYSTSTQQVMVTVMRGRILDGITILAAPVSRKGPPIPKDGNGPTYRNGLFGTLKRQDSILHAVWMPTASASSQPNPARDSPAAALRAYADACIHEDRQAARERFESSVKDLCSGKLNPCAGILLQFSSRENIVEPDTSSPLRYYGGIDDFVL
jgi:hypothetical protein